jgi:hypothetical protein
VDREPHDLSAEEAHETHQARLAWWAAFVATVVLVAALGFVRSAGAETLPAPGAAGTAASVFEFEEDEEGEDEGGEEGDEASDCESQDEAEEEACEEAEEEAEAAAARAVECRLDSAEATVAALPGHDQVRLTVRYRTYQPSAVTVELRLRGGKGALDLGVATARFGRSGVLHSRETLSDQQMAQAMAAKEFTVGLHAINSPHYCRGLFERHLTARHPAGTGLLWSDPGASRRAHSA